MACRARLAAFSKAAVFALASAGAFPSSGLVAALASVLTSATAATEAVGAGAPAVCVPEAPQMPIGAHEGVLHRVLGVVGIGQQMRGHAQAPGVVPVDDQREGVDVAGQAGAGRRGGRGETVRRAGKPIDELAREKNLTRISKIASNENPLGPSPMAIREMTNVLWDVHRYPDMSAYQLKKALSELYRLKPENIVLGNGSEGIMGYICRAFLQEGDEVVTASNTFIGFLILAKSVGAKLIEVPRKSDYKYDIEAMAKKITPDTKIVYLANPDNPTGTYITKLEFDALMKHVSPHTIVILDEASMVDVLLMDALVAALDPAWPGPLPHTVLVGPGGKILWRHNGVIDHATARAAIVAALTPYYAPSATGK